MDDTKVSRRDLLRTAALAGAGLGLTAPDALLSAAPPEDDPHGSPHGTMLGVPFQATPNVRVAIIGAPIDFGELLDAPPSPRAYKRLSEKALSVIGELGQEERELRAREAHSG